MFKVHRGDGSFAGALVAKIGTHEAYDAVAREVTSKFLSCQRSKSSLLQLRLKSASRFSEWNQVAAKR